MSRPRNSAHDANPSAKGMPSPEDDLASPGEPVRRAISPAPTHPRQKQRGGSGPDEVGRHARRRKQRGGTSPDPRA